MQEMLLLPPNDSYRGMLAVLEEAFEGRYKRRDVNLTGILLARPASEFAKKEILPHIDYWHHRSDNYTDFFCPGYRSAHDATPSDGPPVVTVNGLNWYFSSNSFARFLTQLEHHTSWRYGGGCELLVSNARYDSIQQRASLDLSSAIAIDLELAYEDKAFRDVSGLCEAIFQFAKNLNESSDDPCWEFSDHLGMRIIIRFLKRVSAALSSQMAQAGGQEGFSFRR